MISNQPAAAFHYHHHGFDDEDELTVEASNANSQLGTYLLEGEFDDALSYLDTTEGERDATASSRLVIAVGIFLLLRKSIFSECTRKLSPAIAS